VGDITYIATDEGWLFLAVAIDLFSRQVVGWAMRQNMTRELVIDALRMAWFNTIRPRARPGLPQRPGQSVRQQGLTRRAHRIRHHRLNEPARQLLRQRLQQKLVRLAEGRAAARPALDDQAPGQPLGTTEPDCTRRSPTSARCSSKNTGSPANPGKPARSPAMGYGIQGQGHCSAPPSSSIPHACRAHGNKSDTHGSLLVSLQLSAKQCHKSTEVVSRILGR